MLYKTMVHELLQMCPQLHEALRRERKLLPALERLAGQLKASHEQWKLALGSKAPGRDPSQIAAEALEIALQELRDRLPAASPPSADETLSLDAAMAYLQRMPNE